MTKTTFKEKSMKKGSLVIKEVVNRQHRNPKRLNHTHNPPNNFPQHQTHQKGGCTRLYKEQLHMYGTYGQKSVYVCDFQPKTRIYREGSGKNQAKGKPITRSVNGQTYNKMRHINREKQRENQQIIHPNPNKNEVPSGVSNSITEKTSYGLGWTTTDSMTPEINPLLI